MPQTTPPPGRAATSSPKLCVRCGCDYDLTAQITQVENRIRGQPRRSIPRLTRVPGPRPDHEAPAGCPEHGPRPRSSPHAGRDGCHPGSERWQSACCLRLTADIMPPPLRARVVVAGTQSAAPAAAHRGAQLQALQIQRADISSGIGQRLAAHPRCPIPTGQTCVGPPHPAAPGGDSADQDCRPPLIRAGDGTAPRRPLWPPMPPGTAPLVAGDPDPRRRMARRGRGVPGARCPERPAPPCTALSPALTVTPGSSGAAGTTGTAGSGQAAL